MRRKIIIILIVLTSICCIWWLTEYHNTNIWTVVIVSLLINVVSGPLYYFIVEGLYNFKKFGLFWKSYVIFRNKDVRFSISYIFRIKVKDKFLLVKNRKGGYFQPVGGAYKTLPGIETIFKKYKVQPDNRFETSHGIAKNDLRFRVKGKNVMNIINWFESRENREISQWREFCEELLTTNIITDKHAFRYIDYEYSATLQTPMKKAKKLDCQEILIFEIFDLIPNDEQKIELERLLLVGDTEEVKFADEILIKKLGFDERTKETIYEIGAQTKWTLLEKWTDD
jgi:hypothetical protein